MLKDKESKVSKKSLNDFYDFIFKVSPWITKEGTLSLQNLKGVKKKIKRYCKKYGPGKIPTPEFSIWVQIKDLLTDKSEIEFLAEEAPLEQDKESDKNPKDKKKACKNFMSKNDTGLIRQTCLKQILRTGIKIKKMIGF